MTQQQIFEWLEHPERLNRETLCELRTLLARYPYFQTARLLYLKNLFLLHDPSFAEELRKAALYISNRRMLFYLIEGERFSPASLEVKEAPKEETLDRTLSLIDSFLATLSDEPAVPLEIPMEVAAVTTDYTSLLLQDVGQADENAPRLKGQALIDEFIGKQQEKEQEPLVGSEPKSASFAETGTAVCPEPQEVRFSNSDSPDALPSNSDSPDALAAESVLVSETEISSEVEGIPEVEHSTDLEVSSETVVSFDGACASEAVVSSDEAHASETISSTDEGKSSEAVMPLEVEHVSEAFEPATADHASGTEENAASSGAAAVQQEAEPDEAVATAEQSESEISSDEDMDEESYFTETLAKIYVKQQRYSKALEIIKKLNLKYPRKNAYFADQIRFLEKLIINTKSK